MKRKYVTRKEAAEMLGVSRQTVSNYIEKGYLEIRKIKGATYILADDFDRKREALSRIQGATQSVDALVETLNGEEEKLLREIRVTRSVGKMYGREAMYAIMDKNLYTLPDFEKAVVLDLFAYGDIEKVSRDYGISRERVKRLYGKAMNRLERQPTMRSKNDEISALKDEIRHLTHLVDVYRSGEGRGVSGEDRGKIAMRARALKLHEKDIRDCGLSFRAVNCLIGSGFSKVGDLLSMRSADLPRIRNVGRKTEREIRDFMRSNGMCFADEE